MYERELTLDELLDEPMIRKVMIADGYSAEDIRLLMRQATARSSKDSHHQRSSRGARTARLGPGPFPDDVMPISAFGLVMPSGASTGRALRFEKQSHGGKLP